MKNEAQTRKDLIDKQLLVGLTALTELVCSGHR